MPLSQLPPGARGYLIGEESELNKQHQQVGTLAQLAQLQERQRQQTLDQTFREGMAQLGPDAPLGSLARLAIQAGKPELAISLYNHEEARKATKEATMARLQQAATNFETTYQLRLKNANTAEERAILDRQREAFKQNLQSEAQRLAGARGAYDFGFIPNTPVSPTVTPQYDLEGRPPAERAAIQSVIAAGNNPARADVGNYQPPAQAFPMPAPNPPGTSPGAPIRASTVLPPMPPEIAMLPPRAQQQWLLQQARVGANIPRSPESIRDDAMYQIINGTPRPGSIPTGRQGEGNAYRAQIADEIRKIAEERGVTPEQLASGRILNRANSVALNAVTKDLAAITPFKEMLDTNVDVAINLHKKIADDVTNSAYLNRPLLWVKNNLSNRPDIADFLAQMHFVETEAARVLTQPRLVGQLTDTAIKDMKSVVSGNMTLGSAEAVLRRIQNDGSNRIAAMRRERDGLISDVRGETRTAPNELEQQVRSQGIRWEPDKYEYRISPNGDVQRRRK